MYLLDTNHCSYLMNGLDKSPDRQKIEEVRVIRKAQAIPDKIYLSEVSLGELIFGAELSPHKEKILDRIDRFKATFIPVEVDRICWEVYGRTKAVLKAEGKLISDMDLLIACTALRYGCILVSNDTNFKNLPPEFNLENWAGDSSFDLP